jgi:hypothetical protein
MHAIYYKALTPKLSMVFMDPVALLLAIITLFLAYLTLVLGVGGIVNVVEHSPSLYSMVDVYVGSAESFARMLTIFFYVTVSAHALEAVYVGMHAKKTFKLPQNAIIEWVIFTQLAGLPILNRFLKFVEVHDSAMDKKGL